MINAGIPYALGTFVYRDNHSSPILGELHTGSCVGVCTTHMNIYMKGWNHSYTYAWTVEIGICPYIIKYPIAATVALFCIIALKVNIVIVQTSN